ncbi:hypothetical protein K466DRAFT_241142 [Polyporus arcularius HHB13444]|uniref:LIM zinc-binding domain-containing protein n=1 Tax=Polyporus arcularius HHB13444 TaxID=1314778 RepID=A0A5C3PSY8_9APHY|nr:hypothetical protein K466DRAFT_241142 [Polyporus arcularius HHB13444]
MAQLVAPAPASERISQILPTVKCSNCNEPVRITDLGDHVCAPVPPVPQIPALKPPQSPRSVAALLPAKLQGFLNGPPPVQSPPRTSSISQAPSRQKSPAPPQSVGRPRAPSSASSLSVRSGDSRPERVPSPLAHGRPSTDRVPFSNNSGSSAPQRVPSPHIPPPSRPSDVPAALASRMSPGMDRSGTPGRNGTAAQGTAPLRPRAPSSASLRPSLMANAQGGARPPAQSNSTGPQYDPFAGPPPGTSASQSSRVRAGTNASTRPSFEQGPDIIYSTDMRSRTPANDPVRMRAPSVASVRPSVDQMRPSMDRARPSMDQMRRPSAESQRPFMGGPPPPPGTPPLGIPGTPPPREPDTKTGGEAGMAGVGRRGFAAAARVAMFTSMGPAPPMSPDPNGMGPMVPNQGMDGRRANAPRFLDIASATRYAAANTPPLSPGSGTASMSPHSPYSQKSPILAGLSSPNARMSPNLTPTHTAGIASSPTSPVSVHSLRDRVLSPPQEVPKAPAAAEPPSTPRLPFFEKFKNKLPAVDTAKASGSMEPSPVSPASSNSSYDGLAYADSDDEDDLDIPLRASPQPIATPATKPDSKATAPATGAKVRFPSMTNSESRYSSSSSSTESPRLPQRSLSASTSRTIAKSTGALERAMETLFEDGPSSPTTSTGFTETQRDSISKSPKVPMRSHTSPTLSTGRLEQRRSTQRRPTTKACVRCERTIEDGRWIQMEGGSVLCDKCWKNMYLPKCRRCNKAIEKQAVSSSDGQLKGKWHRECFSCFTCEKPFPDKSFYVYDGKPFCAYHYHEANNSLCAAARCGQPIEGPCAVSHAGDRYHPEHFLCEYRGCTERLVEYYELDGRMLCERHMQKAMRERDEDEDEDVDAYDDMFGGAGNRNTMAMKRVTRFIDLAALGPPS